MKEAEKSEVNNEYTPLAPLERYNLSYEQIKSAPRDLWLIIYIKFCFYGSMATLFNLRVIYLTEVLDYSDIDLSIIFATEFVIHVIVFFFLSGIPDFFGLKISIFVPSVMSLAALSLFCIFENKYVQVVVMLLVFPAADALITTSLEVGLKRYTMEQYRTLSISIFTTGKFAATLLGGAAIEIVLVYGSETMETYRMFFICLIAMISTGSFASLFLRKLDVNSWDEVEIDTNSKQTWKEYISELASLKRFWRLLMVICMISLVKSLFYQQNIALPLYMDRELGSESYYGLMVILNQVIVIGFTPIFTYLIYFISAYDIFIIGGVVGSLSPLVFLFGANYYSIVAFIVISSIGESLYTPRIIEYILEISPKGKESGIIAMSYIPISFAVGYSGLVAGLLMDKYCPEDGERNCQYVWVFIAVSALPAPTILFFCRKWLEQPIYESNPYISLSIISKDN